MICDNCFHQGACINAMASRGAFVTGVEYQENRDFKCKHYVSKANIQEVKHGKWIEARFGNGITVPYSKYYICNQCNHTSQKKSRYCHYCGARNGR